MKYTIIAYSAALVVLSFLSALVFGIVMMVETSTGPGCPSVPGADVGDGDYRFFLFPVSI